MTRVCALLVLVACNEPLWPPKGYDTQAPVAPSVEPRDAAPPDPVLDVEAPVDASVVAPAPDPIDAPPVEPMYSAADALADALASPLEHVGTGAWPGNYSTKGCAYRNDRVIVVDVYCTRTEQPAFSVVVLSPAHGRVLIYAEADKPISKATRADYFSFRVETSRAVDLPLDSTYVQITDWETRRYEQCLKGDIDHCYTEGDTCSDGAWLALNEAFVKAPVEDWFELNRTLRKLARTSARR